MQESSVLKRRSSSAVSGGATGLRPAALPLWWAQQQPNGTDLLRCRLIWPLVSRLDRSARSGGSTRGPTARCSRSGMSLHQPGRPTQWICFQVRPRPS